jgi:hypothetical protein
LTARYIAYPQFLHFVRSARRAAWAASLHLLTTGYGTELTKPHPAQCPLLAEADIGCDALILQVEPSYQVPKRFCYYLLRVFPNLTVEVGIIVSVHATLE